MRRGLPFSIDEAGYLQRAIRDGQHLVHGGAGGLLVAIRTPDIQAPLVPVVASLAYPLVHTNLLELLVSLQVFYVGTVIATYALARVWLPRWWAVLTALLVACTPGVLDQSRSFMFAEAATATFAAAVAAQIAARNGRNRGLLLLAGFLSGLTLLSRTMMVALIAVLWLVGALAVLLEPGDRLRRLRNFLLVPVVGSALAAIWYSAQWANVLHYLTRYGYGAGQRAYARAASLPIVGSLPLRLNDLLSQDFYFVAAVLVLIGLCLCLWRTIAAGTAERERSRGLAPTVQLALITIGALAALCSTANSGSAFELPLVPPLAVLAATGWHSALGAKSTKAVAKGLAGASVTAAAATVTIKTLTLLSAIILSIGVGPLSAVVASSSSVISGYLSAFEGSGAAAQATDRGPWLSDSWQVDRFMNHYAGERGYLPIVFFATEAPLFNTNTLQLENQVHRGHLLPVGVFHDPHHVGLTFLQQLSAPQYGIPNFLVAVSGREAAEFTVVPDQHAAQTARAALFRRVLHFRLPDGTWATVYWRATGPRIPVGRRQAANPEPAGRTVPSLSRLGRRRFRAVATWGRFPGYQLLETSSGHAEPR